MAAGGWIQLAVAALSWPGLSWTARFLKRRLLKDPKAQAETRKLNAEASHVEWATLRDEIDRLTKTVRWQGRCIADLKRQDTAREAREDELRQQAAIREARENDLELENKRLRTLVGRLQRRVEGLEKILKVEVKLTPEMKKLMAELEEIDDDEGAIDASD